MSANRLAVNSADDATLHRRTLSRMRAVGYGRLYERHATIPSYSIPHAGLSLANYYP